jgi:hypothetical protein
MKQGLSLPPVRTLKDEEAPPETPPEPAAKPVPPVPEEKPVVKTKPAEKEAPPPRAAPEPRPAASAAKRPAPTDANRSDSKARNSPVYIAAIAGATLGTISVLAVYLLMRPDTTTGARPSGSSPFAHGRGEPSAPSASASAPVPAPSAPPPPAPVAQSPAPLLEGPSIPRSSPPPPPVPESRPIISEARPAQSAPAVAPAPPPAVVAPIPAPTREAPPVPKPSPAPVRAPAPQRRKAAAAKPKAAPPKAAERPSKPKGPAWTFEGVVFDLMTARGVFDAKLTFVDEDGNAVAETATGPNGHYRVTLPARPPAQGYTLMISHADYTDRYIDEGDSTSSLREATPEERKILMQAAARTATSLWCRTPPKSLRLSAG